MKLVKRYIFLNMGRAKSAGVVEKALDKVEHKMFRVVLNEVGEGDKGYDDHKLVREALSDTHQLTHMKTREPIAIPKGEKIIKKIFMKASKGLVKQGPSRSLQETWVDNGPDYPVEVVATGHYHAGAMNGSRKPWVKAFLRVQYLRMLRIHKKRAKIHFKAGRIYVWLMDTNWREFLKIHWNETRIFRDPPDYAGVVMPRGWDVKVINEWEKDQPIESHHDVHGFALQYFKR